MCIRDRYYDRAGNNFEKQKEDYAGKIKDAIEKDGSGNRTGWIVNQMCIRDRFGEDNEGE